MHFLLFGRNIAKCIDSCFESLRFAFAFAALTMTTQEAELLSQESQKFPRLILIPRKHFIQILIPHVARNGLAEHLPKIRC